MPPRERWGVLREGREEGGKCIDTEAVVARLTRGLRSELGLQWAP